MFLSSLKDSLRQAWAPTRKTTLWLLRMMIPISLGVTLLQWLGVIRWIAGYVDPVFGLVGLPGSAAIAYITAAVNTTYAGIAIMTSLPLTLRQATVLSMMMLLCHALPMECTVNRMTGSSLWRMAVIRIFMAFAAAWVLNKILPEMSVPFGHMGAIETDAPIGLVLLTWVKSMLRLCLMIFFIIYALMVVQQLIEHYRLMPKLSKALQPLMRLFGLPRRAAYLWLVGNVLGISYGGAVMREQIDRGVLSRNEANDVNYHLIMNHSLLEDTAVFSAVGISPVCIVVTRLVCAMVVVWSRKLWHRLRQALKPAA